MPSYCHRARAAQFPQRWRDAGAQQGRLWLAAVCSGRQPGTCSHHIRHPDRGQSGVLIRTGSDRDGCEMRSGTKRRVAAFLNIKSAAQESDGFIMCLHVYVNYTKTPVHTHTHTSHFAVVKAPSLFKWTALSQPVIWKCRSSYRVVKLFATSQQVLLSL